MKKILFILLSLILLVGCNESKIEESQTKNEQPQTIIINSFIIFININYHY